MIDTNKRAGGFRFCSLVHKNRKIGSFKPALAFENTGGTLHCEKERILRPYVLVWTASHPHGSMALSASQLDERKV
jgi:hypothetical protein